MNAQGLKTNRKKISASIRNRILAGVLVLAPLGAVFWIILSLWTIMTAIARLVPAPLHPTVFLQLENPVAMQAVDFIATLSLFGLILFLVWAVGLISSNYLGKRLFESISHFFGRVPVLSTVYSTLEQLLKTFSSEKSKNFRRVVQVEYPRKGLFALAFVTGERDGLLHIYVPTTPNPTSGFYLTVPAADVTDVDLSVEQALKEIISMGIVHSEKRRG